MAQGGLCALLISTAWAQTEERTGFSGSAQLGVGYDTNANASTADQNFLGFILDPRFQKSESPFGELALELDHTAILRPDFGFNSSLQAAHRANPDAPFADQTVGSMATEAVYLHADDRYTAGVSAYTDRLDHHDFEQGSNIELGVSHGTAPHLDTAFSLRASRIGYSGSDYAAMDVDRYLVGLTLTREALGARQGSVALTGVAGRDIARQEGSPFGNTRAGLQLSTTWPVLPRAALTGEVSALRSRYKGLFFDLSRRDEQYEGVLTLEFTDWPASGWHVAPQLHYVRNDSTVALYGYDRTEVALYVRRQF